MVHACVAMLCPHRVARHGEFALRYNMVQGKPALAGKPASADLRCATT